LVENNISWGYYSDHDPNSVHQNAHPNNLVVIPENLNQENLLAPLDYDLAFFRQEFLNIEYQSSTYG
jgi:hypothetical protein